MRKMHAVWMSAGIVALGGGAHAADLSDVAKVEVVHAEPYGRYIADGTGRALYVFTADKRGMDRQPAKSACWNTCAATWPPALAKQKPKAGAGVDAKMLSTAMHGDKSEVTYDGRPLYYFKVDWHEGERKGQGRKSFGGFWYLISPDGQPIAAEKPKMNGL